MITLRNLSKCFGERAVLDAACFSVERGETVVLLGPSGSGKTTLLRCIVGLEMPDSGEIELDGIVLNPADAVAVRRENLQRIRRRCGLIFQQFHLFPHLNVVQNLTLGPRHVLGLALGEATTSARELLHQVGLADSELKRPGKLSGGEQQRVAIARALAMKPDYLLYDEPTSSLDRDRAKEIWGIMRDLAGRGQTQVIVTHQEELGSFLNCRLLRMHAGRIVPA